LFFMQLLSKLALINIKQTELIVINFTTLIKINHFKDKSVVGQIQVDSDTAEASDELSEIQTTIKVLVKCTESFTIAFEFLLDTVMDKLKKSIDSREILLKMLVYILGTNKVVTGIMETFEDKRTMLKNIN